MRVCHLVVSRCPMLYVMWVCIGWYTIDVSIPMRWKVVHIRGMSNLLLVWLVPWELDEGGNKCGSILGNDRIV